MDKIWLSRYPKDVPAEIDLSKYNSLADMFENSVRRFADQPAYINFGKVMTFRRLEEKEPSVCGLFAKLAGAEKGRPSGADDA